MCFCATGPLSSSLCAVLLTGGFYIFAAYSWGLALAFLVVAVVIIGVLLSTSGSNDVKAPLRALRFHGEFETEINRISNEIQGYISARAQVPNYLLVAFAATLSLFVLISEIEGTTVPTDIVLACTALVANLIYLAYLGTARALLSDLIMIGRYLARSGQSDWDHRIMPNLRSAIEVKHLFRMVGGMSWEFGINRQVHAVFFVVSFATPVFAHILAPRDELNSDADLQCYLLGTSFLVPLVCEALFVWGLCHTNYHGIGRSYTATEDYWDAVWEKVAKELDKSLILLPETSTPLVASLTATDHTFTAAIEPQPAWCRCTRTSAETNQESGPSKQ